MQTKHFREPKSVENNICIGNIGTHSIVMDEMGEFYFYNNNEHQLEIGEPIDREYITSINKLPADEREVMLHSIYQTLL